MTSKCVMFNDYNKLGKKQFFVSPEIVGGALRIYHKTELQWVRESCHRL